MTHVIVDTKQFEKLRDIATVAAVIAAYPPVDRGHARKAYIDWELIDTLRAQLDELGIDWPNVKRIFL